MKISCNDKYWKIKFLHLKILIQLLIHKNNIDVKFQIVHLMHLGDGIFFVSIGEIGHESLCSALSASQNSDYHQIWNKLAPYQKQLADYCQLQKNKLIPYQKWLAVLLRLTDGHQL